MRAEGYALNTARAATVIAPLVLFLALPPFYNGVWVQVEGAMPWLHLAAGVTLLGLAWTAASGNPVAKSALCHPVVVLPAALFALSILLLPATTTPAVSLLGTPEHGFGALAFLDLAALTAGAIVTLREQRWRVGLLASVLITATTGFALDLLHRRGLTWAPFFFSDYLAYYALAAAVVAAALAGARKIWVLGSYALLAVLVTVADNKTAMLAVAIAGVLIVVLPRRMPLRAMVILCCLLPLMIGTVAALFGETWQESYRDEMIARLGPGFVPNMASSLWASLWSRAMLAHVAVQSLVDSPIRFIVGAGWGHYNEALLANLPIVKSRLFETFGETRSYWDAIQRADFHSHNQYLEALLSTGVGGGVLFLAYGPVLVAAAAPERRRLALFAVLFLATLQTFWFQMPHSLPVMAVMTALLLEGGLTAEFSSRRRFAPILAALAGCALLVAAVASEMAASNIRTALRSLNAGASGPLWPRFAAGLDEIYQASLIQAAFAALGNDRGAGTEQADLETLHDLLSQLESARSLRLRVAEVNVISGLIFRYPAYEERYGSLDDLFGRSVGRLLDAAPRRSDLVAPYFNHLLASGRETEALALANRILAGIPADPIGLWFAGIVLIANPATTAQGVSDLKRSLDGGVGNLMPIPASTAAEIRQMTAN